MGLTDLLLMSVLGGLMAAAIAGVRAIALNRLPKQVFVVLWLLVAARLLVSLQIPASTSVLSLVQQAIPTIGGLLGQTDQTDSFTDSAVPVVDTGSVDVADLAGPPANTADTVSVSARNASSQSNSAGITASTAAAAAEPANAGTSGAVNTLPAASSQLSTALVADIAWAAGALGLAGYFGASHLRWRRNFACSLPVDDKRVRQWLASCGIRRHVAVRVSDRIATPLTYGIVRPVILMPRTTNWDDTAHLPFILAHELSHIRRWDALIKVVLLACVCVHWFNPLVWVSLILSNRDIELACDESVVRTLGREQRAAYARTLLSMEEQRSLPVFMCAAFGKTAIEERIGAIMKTARLSALAIVASAALVIGIPAALATSPVAQTDDTTIGEQAASLQTDAGGATSESPATCDDPELAVILHDYTVAEWARVHEFVNRWFYLGGNNWNLMNAADFRTAALAEFGDEAGRNLLAHLVADEDLGAWVLANGLTPGSTSGGVTSAPSGEAATAVLAWGALAPLTADDWLNHAFTGSYEDPQDSGATLGYTLTVGIEDPAATPLWNYMASSVQAQAALGTVFAAADEKDLEPEGDSLNAAIADAIGAAAWLPLGGTVTVDYTYAFPDGATARDTVTIVSIGAGRAASLGNLAGYLVSQYGSFGLTYEVVSADKTSPELIYLALFYQGTPVAGIYDPYFDIVMTDWISPQVAVVAPDSSTSTADAINLVAVYDGTTLTGLREVPAAEFDALRAACSRTASGTARDVQLADVISAYTNDERARLTSFLQEQFALTTPPYTSTVTVAQFRAAALAAFGDETGQELLAQLAADERLGAWAAAQGAAALDTLYRAANVTDHSAWTDGHTALLAAYTLRPLVANAADQAATSGTLSVAGDLDARLGYAFAVDIDDAQAASLYGYLLLVAQIDAQVDALATETLAGKEYVPDVAIDALASAGNVLLSQVDKVLGVSFTLAFSSAGSSLTPAAYAVSDSTTFRYSQDAFETDAAAIAAMTVRAPSNVAGSR